MSRAWPLTTLRSKQNCGICSICSYCSLLYRQCTDSVPTVYRQCTYSFCSWQLASVHFCPARRFRPVQDFRHSMERQDTFPKKLRMNTLPNSLPQTSEMSVVRQFSTLQSEVTEVTEVKNEDSMRPVERSKSRVKSNQNDGCLVAFEVDDVMILRPWANKFNQWGSMKLLETTAYSIPCQDQSV